MEIIELVYESLEDFASACDLAASSKFMHAIYNSNRRSIHRSILRRTPLLQGDAQSFFDQALELYQVQQTGASGSGSTLEVALECPVTISKILHDAMVIRDLAIYMFDVTMDFDYSMAYDKVVPYSYSHVDSFMGLAHNQGYKSGVSYPNRIVQFRNALYTIWMLSILLKPDDLFTPSRNPFVSHLIVRFLCKPYYRRFGFPDLRKLQECCNKYAADNTRLILIPSVEVVLIGLRQAIACASVSHSEKAE